MNKFLFKFLHWMLDGLNSHDMFERFVATGKVSAIPATILFAFRDFTDWYIVNEIYLYLVFGMVVLDHALGSIVHFFYKKDFSLEGNMIGLIIKVTVILASISIGEAIKYPLKNVDFLVDYFNIVVNVSIMVYPAYPAIKNIDIMANGKSPFHWLISIIEKFQQDGDLSHFRTTKNPDKDGGGRFGDFEDGFDFEGNRENNENIEDEQQGIR